MQTQHQPYISHETFNSNNLSPNAKNQLEIKQLQFYLQQRDSQIERLETELSKRQIVTPLLKKPNLVKMRVELENKQKRLIKAEQLIDRYVQIIKDLYHVVGEISGTPVDLKALNFLEHEKRQWKGQKAGQIIQSKGPKFQYRQTSKSESNNNLNADNIKSEKKQDADEFKARPLEINLLYTKDIDKQVLLEFNQKHEAEITNLICCQLLQVPTARAMFAHVSAETKRQIMGIKDGVGGECLRVMHHDSAATVELHQQQNENNFNHKATNAHHVHMDKPLDGNKILYRNFQPTQSHSVTPKRNYSIQQKHQQQVSDANRSHSRNKTLCSHCQQLLMSSQKRHIKTVSLNTRTQQSQQHDHSISINEENDENLMTSSRPPAKSGIQKLSPQRHNKFKQDIQSISFSSSTKKQKVISKKHQNSNSKNNITKNTNESIDSQKNKKYHHGSSLKKKTSEEKKVYTFLNVDSQGDIVTIQNKKSIAGKNQLNHQNKDLKNDITYAQNKILQKNSPNKKVSSFNQPNTSSNKKTPNQVSPPTKLTTNHPETAYHKQVPYYKDQQLISESIQEIFSSPNKDKHNSPIVMNIFESQSQVQTDRSHTINIEKDSNYTKQQIKNKKESKYKMPSVASLKQIKQSSKALDTHISTVSNLNNSQINQSSDLNLNQYLDFLQQNNKQAQNLKQNMQNNHDSIDSNYELKHGDVNNFNVSMSSNDNHVQQQASQIMKKKYQTAQFLNNGSPQKQPQNIKDQSEMQNENELKAEQQKTYSGNKYKSYNHVMQQQQMQMQQAQLQPSNVLSASDQNLNQLINHNQNLNYGFDSPESMSQQSQYNNNHLMSNRENIHQTEIILKKSPTQQQHQNQNNQNQYVQDFRKKQANQNIKQIQQMFKVDEVNDATMQKQITNMPQIQSHQQQSQQSQQFSQVTFQNSIVHEPQLKIAQKYHNKPIQTSQQQQHQIQYGTLQNDFFENSNSNTGQVQYNQFSSSSVM